MPEFKPNTLYYGDNLTVLRDFPPECVDLVYLDPPFNSNRSYNILFRESKGTESEAQIQAFEDTWHWGKEGSTAAAYYAVVSRGDDVGKMPSPRGLPQYTHAPRARRGKQALLNADIH